MILIHIILHSCRSYFLAVESYIESNQDLSSFLTCVRATYKLWLDNNTSTKETIAITQRTLPDTIEEVYYPLNTLVSYYTLRNWQYRALILWIVSTKCVLIESWIPPCWSPSVLIGWCCFLTW